MRRYLGVERTTSRRYRPAATRAESPPRDSSAIAGTAAGPTAARRRCGRPTGSLPAARRRVCASDPRCGHHARDLVSPASSRSRPMRARASSTRDAAARLDPALVTGAADRSPACHGARPAGAAGEPPSGPCRVEGSGCGRAITAPEHDARGARSRSAASATSGGRADGRDRHRLDPRLVECRAREPAAAARGDGSRRLARAMAETQASRGPSPGGGGT